MSQTIAKGTAITFTFGSRDEYRVICHGIATSDLDCQALDDRYLGLHEDRFDAIDFCKWLVEQGCIKEYITKEWFLGSNLGPLSPVDTCPICGLMGAHETIEEHKKQQHG